MYLLDTDTVSGIMHQRPGLRLEPKLASTPDALQYTSSITVGEIIYGAHKKPERTEYLIQLLEQEILTVLRILPFDEDAARIYGPLRLDLERRGRVIGEPDTRIAAIALSHNLTVVTGNTRHFERIPGLSVENWLL
ncbi:MAG: PIN domain-containing protein [Dehalococcoidia bacterium]